jgi:hypothetical protein
MREKQFHQEKQMLQHDHEDDSGNRDLRGKAEEGREGEDLEKSFCNIGR